MTSKTGNSNGTLSRKADQFCFVFKKFIPKRLKHLLTMTAIPYATHTVCCTSSDLNHRSGSGVLHLISTSFIVC